jgi:recombination protein RecA
MLEQIADKVRALKSVLVAVEKQFGKGAVMTLGEDEEPVPVASFSSGSLALDLATGIGGYPRGRVVEIYGPESSGKTTLALHAITQAQRAGGVAAFIDAEHAVDVAYARSIGVETEKLLISQPDTGEQALDITEMLVRSGAVDLVVIDSVAALTPKAELEGEMGDAHMGLQARLMSQALRKLTAAAYRSETTLMFLNQLRQKIGVTFGSPETTTGGNALKFYASMRFDVRRIGQVKVGDEPVGGRTRVKIAKNKCAPPFTEAEFEIRWGTGIDTMSELLDLGVARGLVDKAGNHLSFAGSPLGNGRERSRDTLAGSVELQSTLRQAIVASGPVRPGRRADAEA